MPRVTVLGTYLDGDQGAAKDLLKVLEVVGLGYFALAADQNSHPTFAMALRAGPGACRNERMSAVHSV
jgi:hypothetical protein